MAELTPRGRVVYRGQWVVARFDMDRHGFRQIAVNPSLRDSCLRAVTAVALPYAKSISPRSDRHHRHYQDSFVVQSVRTGLAPPEIIGTPPMMRVAARLVNIAPHAAAVEWGTRGRPAHHILRKTIDHLNSLGRRKKK